MSSDRSPTGVDREDAPGDGAGFIGHQMHSERSDITYLHEASEDIYSLADGKPFHDNQA